VCKNGGTMEKLIEVYITFVLPHKPNGKIAVIYICVYLLFPASKLLVIFNNECYFSWRIFGQS
jgi:hypothetical protein